MGNMLRRKGGGTILLESLECQTKVLLFISIATEGLLKTQNRGGAYRKLCFRKIIQTAGSRVKNGLKHTPNGKTR